ncbi:hypothetical protein ACOSP7_007937 [Xanthoceras sorbifolium]|uniref:Transcriptional coactivator Hfi1/Transcriptional adapter 1 n=1 Tax=Xanthoceras sorbifolium TaxID=99658 RepID=A0ABQ8IBF0_9ROSI|nr:hypothetical protein JRO89_XS03G0233700 [Xanthoceras sorbifolium]
MQPQQGSRIDLVELKTQIVKKIGTERSKKYFYILNRFLSQKLSKSQFDQSCHLLLGKENLPLHNQLIRSILKNACQAKTPPPVNEAALAKSAIQGVKSTFSREDGHEQSGSLVPNQNQNIPIWSNGVLPVSPRRVRTGNRDRKLKDRANSLLGPNGKIECVSHQLASTEDSSGKLRMENGVHCDYQRPLQHLHTVAEQPVNGKEGSLRPTEKLRIPDDEEEVEQANHLNLSRSPLLAPLGIPFCSASVGGARKPIPVSSGGDFVSYYDSVGLSDTETLRKRMEQIATAQGLGGVSLECANTLNNMLDVYLKRLIKSCVELVGARSAHEPRRPPINKQQLQSKVINGTWPSNHLHIQSASGPVDITQDQRPRCSVSLLDFKVAMELNPQKLGEDWPLLLEKICMQSFEE